MDDAQYLDYCRKLLRDFAADLVTRADTLADDDPLRELSAAFSALLAEGQDVYRAGPVLVARLFTTYPELAPLFPRQLLWFLGGDCLHYMPDEEIEQFQRLEELRLAAARRGETFDLRGAPSKLLNLQ